MNNQTLRVTEIFYSLQGETTRTGLPTIFVRLTGCPLRCHYCDTAYAFSGGKRLSFVEIFQQMAAFKTPYVTVTGGEPLAQAACLSFLTALADKDYDVSLETSGAFLVNQVDPRILKIVDIKTPASGEEAKNKYQNFAYLSETDQLKFVISNRADYDWSKAIITEYALWGKFTLLFSPTVPVLQARELADWILEDQLPVRLQIQLHKYLWDDARGR